MGSFNEPLHLPLPAKDHERLADIADSITANDLKTAREEIIEELCEGKKVDGLHAGIIFDLAAQESGHAGYHGLIAILEGVLSLRYRDPFSHTSLQNEARGYIERYVDAHPDMIQERAEKNEQDRLEDAE